MMKKKGCLLRALCGALVLTLAWGSVAPSVVFAVNVTIPPGTTVPVKLLTPVSSATSSVGDIVSMSVDSDITVKGRVVIPAGAVAQGTVTTAKKKGLLGFPGVIGIQVNSIKLPDGGAVMISGGRNLDGSDNMVLAIAVTILCLFGFLISGGDVAMPVGTVLATTVSAPAEVDVP